MAVLKLPFDHRTEINFNFPCMITGMSLSPHCTTKLWPLTAWQVAKNASPSTSQIGSNFFICTENLLGRSLTEESFKLKRQSLLQTPNLMSATWGGRAMKRSRSMSAYINARDVVHSSQEFVEVRFTCTVYVNQGKILTR